MTEGKRLLLTCARHLPPQKSWAGVASKIHATFCMGSTSSGQLSVSGLCVGRSLSPGQLRYGRYFQRIVTPSKLPAPRTGRLLISTVVLYGYDLLHGKIGATEQLRGKPGTPGIGREGSLLARSTSGISDASYGSAEPSRGRALMAIYQRGQEIWANRATAEASSSDLLLSRCV